MEDLMKLSPAEKQLVADWLKDKAKNGCEVCDNRSWSVGDHITTPVIIDENNGFAFGGQVIPTVQVTCSNCGNTKSYNAIMVGIITSQGVRHAK